MIVFGSSALLVLAMATVSSSAKADDGLALIIAAQQAEINRLKETPRFIATTNLPGFHAGLVGTQWVPLTAGSPEVSYLEISDPSSGMLESDDRLQVRMCLNYRDTCTDEHGYMEARISQWKDYDPVYVSTVMAAKDMRLSWSDSRVAITECTDWQDAKNILEKCTPKWESTCRIEVRHTRAACMTTVNFATMHWRALKK